MVAELFGLDIDDPVATETVSDSVLRQLCGAYLRAPQFMLAGLVRNDTYDVPRYRVCNSGPCTYREMCEALEPSLAATGHRTVCYNDSVAEPMVWSIGAKVTTQKPAGNGFTGKAGTALKAAR